MSQVSSRGRLLFFSTINPPFIAEDERTLRRHFDVARRQSAGVRALLVIPREVARSDAALAWFGSVYAGWLVLWSKLLRKRSAIVVAGVDASKDPEINYGIWLTPWKATVMRFAYRNADRVLAVSPFLAAEVKRLAEYDGRNVLFIPFGFDGTAWAPGRTRDPIVTTVASCENEARFRKKGIDHLFEAARRMPEVRFRIIGMTAQLLAAVRATVPGNVEILTYVPREELLPHLQRSKVYCQPSFTEGLPNALCEAMLCGCIPVGTNVGGIPTVIGDAGFLVKYGDVDALVGALKAALASPRAAEVKARERILKEFPVERRERELVAAIRNLFSGGRE